MKTIELSEREAASIAVGLYCWLTEHNHSDENQKRLEELYSKMSEFHLSYKEKEK